MTTLKGIKYNYRERQEVVLGLMSAVFVNLAKETKIEESKRL